VTLPSTFATGWVRNAPRSGAVTVIVGPFFARVATGGGVVVLRVLVPELVEPVAEPVVPPVVPVVPPVEEVVPATDAPPEEEPPLELQPSEATTRSVGTDQRRPRKIMST
jgi:hypothetical protein